MKPLLSVSGNHSGRRSVSCPHRPGHPLLPAHVAHRSTAIGRSVGGGEGGACAGLASVALPSHHALPQPRRLLLHGLPVDKGQRASGGIEGSASFSRSTSQWFPGHAGGLRDWSADGRVPVGEQQTPRHRR